MEHMNNMLKYKKAQANLSDSEQEWQEMEESSFFKKMEILSLKGNFFNNNYQG